MPRKIDELEELNASPASGDLIPIVDVSDGSDGTTKRITFANLTTGIAATVPTGTGLRKVVAGVEDAAASTLVNADVSASAAIALSKIVNPTGTGLVKATSGVIDAASSTLVNADVNAAAAIAGSKISPDFGAQAVVTTSSFTGAYFATTGTVPAAGLIRIPNSTSDAVIAAKNSGAADKTFLGRVSTDHWQMGHQSDWNVHVYASVLRLWGQSTCEIYGASSGGSVPTLALSSTETAVNSPVVGQSTGSSPYSAHGGFDHTFAADSNYTVTAAQFKYDYCKFNTGSWSTDRSVIFPHPGSMALGYYKTVFNNTTRVMTVSTGTGTTTSLQTLEVGRFFFDNSGVRLAGAPI